MIEAYIEAVSEVVRELDIIERWGKVCQKETDNKDGFSFVYGIQNDPEKQDCHGTTYTPDDRFESVGFIYLDNFKTEMFSGTKNASQVTFETVIQIYVSSLKIGKFNNWYNLGLELTNKLNLQGHKFTAEGKQILGRFESITLREKKTMVISCDYSFTPETAIGC